MSALMMTPTLARPAPRRGDLQVCGGECATRTPHLGNAAWGCTPPTAARRRRLPPACRPNVAPPRHVDAAGLALRGGGGSRNSGAGAGSGGGGAARLASPPKQRGRELGGGGGKGGACLSPCPRTRSHLTLPHWGCRGLGAGRAVCAARRATGRLFFWWATAGACRTDSAGWPARLSGAPGAAVWHGANGRRMRGNVAGRERGARGHPPSAPPAPAASGERSLVARPSPSTQKRNPHPHSPPLHPTHPTLLLRSWPPASRRRATASTR